MQVNVVSDNALDYFLKGRLAEYRKKDSASVVTYK